MNEEISIRNLFIDESYKYLGVDVEQYTLAVPVVTYSFSVVTWLRSDTAKEVRKT